MSKYHDTAPLPRAWYQGYYFGYVWRDAVGIRRLWCSHEWGMTDREKLYWAGLHKCGIILFLMAYITS